MAGSHLNLMKLSVGSESVETMAEWQRRRAKQLKGGLYYHATRMWPKREADILAGGSIYWVIQGMMQARQRILELREVRGDDGVRRCGIVLDPKVVRVEPVRKRPFQGWRYLSPADAPADLSGSRVSELPLPPELARILAEIGVR